MIHITSTAQKKMAEHENSESTFSQRQTIITTIYRTIVLEKNLKISGKDLLHLKI